MKKYLTILSLFITTIAFSQTTGQKVVVKVQGAVTTSDVSKIVKDSIDSIQATVIKVARPLRFRESDSTLVFQNDTLPAQLTYESADTSSIGDDDKNIPSVGWVNGRLFNKQDRFVTSVNDYGGVGDGITDNHDAIQAAFDAAPANSTIIFPDSSYYTTGNLILSKPVSLIGLGGNYSLDLTDKLFHNTGTKIWINSTTDSLLKVTAVGCNFDGIAFINRSTTEPTGGYGVYLTNAGSFTVKRCTFMGFYDNLKIEESVAWSINSSNFINPTNYNVYIRNPIVNDEGDGSIVGCNFLSNNSTATGIRQESSGGLKVANCKFHPILGNSTRYFAAIDVHATSSTSILMVSNCSIEGFSGYGIRVANEPGNYFNKVVINSNQFYPVATITGNCIRLDTVVAISVVGNIFSDNNSNTQAAIALNNCSYATLYPNQMFSWLNKFAIAGGGGVDTTSADAVLTNGNQSINGAKTFNEPITVHVAGVGDVTMGGASIFGNRPVFYNGNDYAGGSLFFYGDNLSFMKADLSTVFFDMNTTANKSYYPLSIPVTNGVGNFITRNSTSGNLTERTAAETQTDIGFVKNTATLSSGTVTVSSSAVTSSSKIILSVNTPSGTQGLLSAPSASIIDGTSFVINSSSASDNSTVNWVIIN